MLKLRKAKGFTLIELLVVVVIIGILAAIALPNFIGAQKKAKISSVKANMHTCQLSSESYGTDSGGAYGAAATNLAPYFPGGSNQIGGTAGNYPTNPMTAKTNEVPGTSAIATTTALMTSRTTAAVTAASGITTGQIGYVGFSDASSYSVVGADDNAKYVMGTGGIMVLSNQ